MIVIGEGRIAFGEEDFREFVVDKIVVLVDFVLVGFVHRNK
jgi:hypothetical protein